MRVMLADQRNSVRIALRLFLEEQEGIQIVSEVCRVGELVRDAPKIQPELIILNWDLVGFQINLGEAAPPRRTYAQVKAVVISSLHKLGSNPGVVVLCNQQEDCLPALYAGADAFIDQGQFPAQLPILLKSVRDKRAKIR
ncbi:MAG TPA: hypothetical protein VMT46_03290 [Anaerolineaceae bacterium]|nr:hypothetical protein [Anaerolineaceae bacterium]